LFDPTDLHESAIDIRDIAHALALQCRFGGHCREFYSVAEHCVRVAQFLEQHGFTARTILQGLLHDASEAYLMDVPKPVKIELPDYNHMEHQVQAAIFRKFGLPEKMPAAVKWADAVMLVTEARDLMSDGGKGLVTAAIPVPDRIYPRPPKEAEAIFMAKFEFYDNFRSACGNGAR
jgi:hypothetical protein